MAADHANNQVEKGHDKPAACPDSSVSFGPKELQAVRFDRLDRNEKETVNLISDTFAKDLGKGQGDVFNKSIMDAMESRVGSLAKLSQPENQAAAKQFLEMMNNAGFDVSLNHSKNGSETTHSLTIFEHGSQTGMRFNSVSEGNSTKSVLCNAPDPVERNAKGAVSSTHDFQAVIDTQKALAGRVKAYLDRE